VKESRFYPEAALMLRSLPAVAAEDCFALKGGTAINFFVRDMPRLSVDIDLTYLPIQDRNTSLQGINDALLRIAKRIRALPGTSHVNETRDQTTGHCRKLVAQNADAQIKIEPSLVIRGTINPPETRSLVPAAQELFELDVSVPVVSMPDLYGGKFCAALDRQHPRDLFDVKLELEADGLTDAMRKGFLVYLISHDRPIRELINPTRMDQRGVFEREFRGMTTVEVTYEALAEAREQLIVKIAETLTHDEKAFIVSVKEANPRWELLGLDGIDRLPAVQWKLLNLRRMSAVAHEEAVKLLKKKLEI
jgi:predicted nucleotidyltransferase component of viral defense system